ncbi:MAG TPA: hypothetical protein VND40_05595 [Nitrososphaerales archaeon]|nr:hypothetical protein [Nitrososphaerales archaeon]
MPEDSANVKIRVKSGESEAEIEASLSNIRQAIELIPDVLAKLPQSSLERRPAPVPSPAQFAAPRASEPAPVAVQASGSPSPSIPTVSIEKGDSLSDVISKFFADPWGRNPRKLMEVRDALQSYGLNYPKQSVAVALLRLAKSSRIRRFKGEGGEYVYTAPTGAGRVPTPVQPSGVQHEAEEEAAPALEVADEEEQLNLDAPSAN